MAEMISVREAAERWKITERRVSTLCKDGKIAGAEKQGKRWMIPADTQKPVDQRIRTGAYRKTERASRLPLPIGVSSYRLASSEYYYIDKTLMIRDFIDDTADGDAVYPPAPIWKNSQYGYVAHLFREECRGYLCLFSG